MNRTRCSRLLLALAVAATASAASAASIKISCGAVGQELELCKRNAEAWAAKTGNQVQVVATPNDSSERLALYLKREHRVGLRARLANALAGFGFVSRSLREACVLDALAREGVGCAEWVAAGEDGRGRAFLLLREVEDAVDVRTFLRDHADNRRRRKDTQP